MKIKNKTGAFIVCAIVLALVAPASTRAATLVQYWPFDESPGANVSSNIVASGNTAVLVNADTNSAWVNSGLATQLTNSTGAVTLDGVDDYVNLGVLGLNGAATVSLWINPNSFNGDVRLFSALTDNSTYAGLVRFDTFGSGNIQEISNVPGSWPNSWLSVNNNGLPPVGQWTHLAFSFHNGIVILYVNGVKQGQIYGGFQFDVSQFGLGAKFNGGGLSFSGAIDDVSVWNGPLSTNSVAQLASGVSPTNIVDSAPAPQGAHLVQYFPLDDGTGSTTAANSVAGGNTGILVGSDAATTWTNDRPSQLTSSSSALVFDGVDDYVNLGNLNMFGSGAVSLWLKPATNNADIRIYSQTSGLTTTAPGLIGIVGSGLQVYNSSTTVRIAPDGTLPTNQWTHVVVSYDDGYATAYINGVPQITTKAVFAFNLDPFGLGANFRLTSGKKFMGIIDDVSIWDNALSAASIQQLASGVSPLSITDAPQTLPGASISVAVTNQPGAVLKQYFPLEGSGDTTNVANLAIGGNAARLVNYTASLTPWATNGLAAQLTNSTAALVLDGSGNYANLGNVGLAGTATIALWIKPKTVTAGGMLFGQLSGPASGPTSHQGAVGLTGNGGLFVRGGNAGPALAPDGTIVANQWTHVAFVYNAGNLATYVNGTNISSTISGCTFDTDPFGIGAPLWALSTPLYQNFPGQMDDVALWSGALSDTEIQSLAAGTSPLVITNSANLVQYFPLDGTGTNLVVSNAVPTGNQGQLVNYNATARSWETNDLPPIPNTTRSLFLDGINDFINVGNIGQNGSGTVALWIKPNTLAGDQRLLSQLSGATTQQGHVGYHTNGEVWAWAGNAYRYPGAPGTLAAGQWYHLTFTFGGGVMTLYVNGTEIGSSACGFQFSTAEMGLGSKWINLYGNSVSGFLDDISIWSGPLAPDTIEKLAAGAPANSVTDAARNLVISWPGYPGGYYTLQSAPSISGPWTIVPQAKTLSGSDYKVAVPIVSSTKTKFFRLIK